jgi:AraC-like DNA-binding protein
MNDNVYEVSAGDLLCFSEGDKKEAISYPDTLMHCFSVNFRLNSADGAPIAVPFPPVKHIGYRTDIVRFFRELTDTLMSRTPGYSIKMCGLFTLILHRLYELTVYGIDSEIGDYRVKKISRYISQHYQEKLTVKKMASLVNLNTVYFGSLFKKETGFTVNRYITRVRIRNAETMLRSGMYKVTDVAERCGYTDLSHFYKHFRDIVGVVPSHCSQQQ